MIMEAKNDFLIGFVVNPIAGMGGSVGLKGTDGLAAKAMELGATMIAPKRGAQFLSALTAGPRFITCSGGMGEESFSLAGIDHNFEIVCRAGSVDSCQDNTVCSTTSDDTRSVCRAFLERGVDLIVFCGGDGTARDVYGTVENAVPIIGVPTGVKMFSGVFANTPETCAALVEAYMKGEATVAEAEIVDLDEDAYREDRLSVDLFGVAKVPYQPHLVQSQKGVTHVSDDREYLQAIGKHLAEEIEKDPDTLFLLGAGSTVASAWEELDIDEGEHTLLGVDAVHDGAIVGTDLNEQGILALLGDHEKAVIVVSPIGSQGFIFGRGNQQFTPAVLERVGLMNIIISATPGKLQNTPELWVDTGSSDIDSRLTGFRRILVGYHNYAMRKIMSGVDQEG